MPYIPILAFVCGMLVAIVIIALLRQASDGCDCRRDEE